MSTSKSYMEFIMGQLGRLEDIRSRQMMGEYIIYYKDRIFAYVCDDTFFVKPVPSAFEMLPDAPLRPPYRGAKDMIVVENVDDARFLCRLAEKVFPELTVPKKKAKKSK